MSARVVCEPLFTVLGRSVSVISIQQVRSVASIFFTQPAAAAAAGGAVAAAMSHADVDMTPWRLLLISKLGRYGGCLEDGHSVVTAVDDCLAAALKVV